MELIRRILNTEETNYSSPLKEEHLKEKMQQLFTKGTMRVEGRLTSENEFTVYDKLTVVGWSVPNQRRKSAYLKGKILPSEKGTMIALKVNPNSILPVFAIIAFLIGTVVTMITLSSTQYDPFILTFGLVLLSLGVIYYPLSSILRNRLRNKIVRYLELRKE